MLIIIYYVYKIYKEIGNRTNEKPKEKKEKIVDAEIIEEKFNKNN